MLSVANDKASDLKQLIASRKARIGIVGMGYVGLPLALLFSEERFRVTGFDIDSRKVNTLNEGGSYIVRIPGTEIQLARQNGFSATADYRQIAEMDVVIICVPTPLTEHHEPDLSFVTGTVRNIAPRLREGQLIILESTTFPGTTEEVVVPLLEGKRQTKCMVDLFAGPVGRGKFCDAPKRCVREPRQDIGEVVAHRDFEAAAAFDHREDGGYTRSGLFTADVDPVVSANCDGPH